MNEKAQDMENKLEVAKRDIVALKKETKERDDWRRSEIRKRGFTN